MRKLLFFISAALLLASPAYAQAGGAAAAASGNWNWSFAALGLGFAVGLAALGQSRVASSVAEGMARNPSARPGIQLALFLGLAFIESLVLFIWVMIFLNVPAAPKL
ncbi:MAG: ATP synthase F0 subunit C [Acidobacteria bacterium]|nr:ATP synthase F0 subunit C [Acidobacteriota bacterium]